MIMLTSAGHGSDGARRRELGLAACLTKPVKQSELLSTIITTLSKSSQAATRLARAAQPASTERNRNVQILLVEDNLVNQRLAVRLLEKQGHQVIVANNGREAIAALEQERFDLVLMDIQMPEMSGLEATAVIRAREQETGAHIPIVAMTAHAMQGDRERCLAAGMDGYISKPIQTAELFKLIAELVPEPAAAPAAVPAVASAPPEEVFDTEVALARVEGDRQLLAELAELFAGEGPDLLANIKQAIARGAGDDLARAAHTLKGTVSNFGAQVAMSLAMRLEELGRAESLHGAELTYASLEAEIGRLSAALNAFARNGAH